jgi:hypothetical protein
MFLNDDALMITPRLRTFDPALKPKVVFCGESIFTEYYVAGVSKADIDKVCAFVEEYRAVLTTQHGEINVYLVTNEGYFAPLYTSWETVLERLNCYRSRD